MTDAQGLLSYASAFFFLRPHESEAERRQTQVSGSDLLAQS